MNTLITYAIYIKTVPLCKVNRYFVVFVSRARKYSTKCIEGVEPLFAKPNPLSIMKRVSYSGTVFASPGCIWDSNTRPYRLGSAIKRSP